MQELYGIPGFPGYNANPVEAVSSVSPEALGQIILFMAWAELKLNDGKYFMMDMCAVPNHRARRLWHPRLPPRSLSPFPVAATRRPSGSAPPGSSARLLCNYRFEDKERVPGNVGFDPLKFGENKETRERLEMAELKNGRLAMLAFSGMLHQVFVTGKPVLASLGDIFAAP